MRSLATVPGITLVLAGLGSAASTVKRDLPVVISNELPNGYSYLGCYSDNVASRQLSLANYVDDGNMTQESCIRFCQGKGFPYAGVEYSSECYCGYTLSRNTESQPDTACNYPCTGNKTEACGAGDRLSVFNTNAAVSKPNFNPGPPGWNSLGCYNDNINNNNVQSRVLAGDSFMSVLQCTNACQAAGYAYAGVEYSTECYCDNQILSGASNSQSGCSMPCSGNSSEYCGGPDRINIYQSTSTPKSISTIPNGWTAQGCFKDNVLGRALVVGMPVPGGHAGTTVGSCITACASAGYKIAGVEYGQECWCDNQIQNGGQQTLPSDGCNMPCRGNTNELCGGSNRLNVYAQIPLSSPISSSTTSSATASSSWTSSSVSSSFSTSTVSATSSSSSSLITSSSSSSSSSTTKSSTSSSSSSSVNGCLPAPSSSSTNPGCVANRKSSLQSSSW
ncbi:copper radical oxidase [Colletotrichum truncatum]|uniref:Copper radical oxidase n=1 Tax=Colletotrichum truncatum TaxID=5467 RepID=A0ACC3ZEZ1_COLTU|nr:copper radical oxidase [Colletotrichum truncatum]KAF6801581.1 copper radical oxidase [Colletotrichum truncatum]